MENFLDFRTFLGGPAAEPALVDTYTNAVCTYCDKTIHQSLFLHHHPQQGWLELSFVRLPYLGELEFNKDTDKYLSLCMSVCRSVCLPLYVAVYVGVSSFLRSLFTLERKTVYGHLSYACVQNPRPQSHYRTTCAYDLGQKGFRVHGRVGRLVPGPSNALVDDVTYTQCASECRLRIAIACGYACRQFNNNVTWYW